MEINNNSTTNPKLAVMPSTSNTSSICKNSDASLAYGIGVVGGGGGDDEDEVQSEYKGGPLDSLNALEEVLPYKKSISNFYHGKSKSFSSTLSNVASCPTIEDISKPENAYTRKRKNLLASSSYWDINEGITSRGTNDETSKRTAYSRSMLSFGKTSNSFESTRGETFCSNSSSPGCCRPPLPPHTRVAILKEQSTNSKYTG